MNIYTHIHEYIYIHTYIYICCKYLRSHLKHPLMSPRQMKLHHHNLSNVRVQLQLCHPRVVESAQVKSLEMPEEIRQCDR